MFCISLKILFSGKPCLTTSHDRLGVPSMCSHSTSSLALITLSLSSPASPGLYRQIQIGWRPQVHDLKTSSLDTCLKHVSPNSYLLIVHISYWMYSLVNGNICSQTYHTRYFTNPYSSNQTSSESSSLAFLPHCLFDLLLLSNQHSLPY